MLVSIALVVFLGMAALTVDVGMVHLACQPMPHPRPPPGKDMACPTSHWACHAGRRSRHRPLALRTQPHGDDPGSTHYRMLTALC